MESILAIVASYLWGAVPTAYLAARLSKGIDLRMYGSGNLGSSNLSTHAGRTVGISVGVFDCLAKGALPVALSNLFDVGSFWQVGVGLAAVAGHNWSPYVKFTGGRGVATAVGVLLGFLLWRELLVLALLLGVLGWVILHDTGFWTFMSSIVLPPLAFLFEVAVDGGSMEMVYLSAGLVSLILLKRMTGNWEMPSKDLQLARVFVYRLMYDRDVPRQAAWVKRRPPEQ